MLKALKTFLITKSHTKSIKRDSMNKQEANKGILSHFYSIILSNAYYSVNMGSHQYSVQPVLYYCKIRKYYASRPYQRLTHLHSPLGFDLSVPTKRGPQGTILGPFMCITYIRRMEILSWNIICFDHVIRYTFRDLHSIPMYQI